MATNGITEVKANGATQATQAAQAAQAAGVKAEPTYAELKARIAALEAMAATKDTGITVRIKDGKVKGKDGVEQDGKGTVCVYGLGRFPVPLYAEQWERLLTPENVKLILDTCKDPRAARKAAK